MIIRECQEQDCERIVALNSCLGYEYSLEDTKTQLLKLLDCSEHKIFVACIEDKAVGYIHINDYDCLYMDSMKNILGLVVDDKYQGQGVGKALLIKAEEWARESGSKGVRLNSAMRRKEAHKFYEKCGYHNRKVQKNYIKIF